MDPPLPDILVFTPWSKTEHELDILIEMQYKQLRELYSNNREYKLDLSMNLENMLNYRKMKLWSTQVEKDIRNTTHHNT